MLKFALTSFVAMGACFAAAQAWVPSWSVQVGNPAGKNVIPIKTAWDSYNGHVCVLSQATSSYVLTLEEFDGAGNLVASGSCGAAGFGNFTLSASSHPPQEVAPVDMTIDAYGNIYVLTSYNGGFVANEPMTVGRFNVVGSAINLTGQVNSTPPSGNGYYPVSIKLGSSGQIWVLGDNQYISPGGCYDQGDVLVKINNALAVVETETYYNPRTVQQPASITYGVGETIVPFGILPVKLYVFPDSVHGDKAFFIANTGSYTSTPPPFYYQNVFSYDDAVGWHDPIFVNSGAMDPAEYYTALEDINGDANGVYVSGHIAGHPYQVLNYGIDDVAAKVANVAAGVLTYPAAWGVAGGPWPTQNPANYAAVPLYTYASTGDLWPGPGWQAAPTAGQQDANILALDGTGNLYLSGLSIFPYQTGLHSCVFAGGIDSIKLTTATFAYVWGPTYWGTTTTAYTTSYDSATSGIADAAGVFILGLYQSDTALVQISPAGATVKSYNSGTEAAPKNIVFGSSGEIYALSGYVAGHAYLRRFNP